MIVVKDNKSLNEAISFLENKQRSEAYLLREHFEFTKEQLNPVNIVKEKVHDLAASTSFRGKVIKGAVGVVSGFLAKRFLLGGSHNPLAKMAGKALQAGVSGLIINKAPSHVDLGHIKEDSISMLQRGLQKLKIK